MLEAGSLTSLPSWCLQEYEHHRGVTARVRGALSLVNLLWAVAIGGVAVSVGPALYVLASPFQRLLAVVFLRAAALVSQVPHVHGLDRIMRCFMWTRYNIISVQSASA